MKYSKNVIIPSLSGFQYGYNTTIIAAAILFVKTTFTLSAFEEGILVSTPMIGLWLASFSSILANHIGRKPSLCLGAIFFAIGCFFSSVATHYPVLLLGRFLVGIGAGITIVVAPIYLVEASADEVRGRVINLNQVGIAAGSFLAYLVGYLLSFSANWRGMFAIGVPFAILQLIGLFFIPETADAAKREEFKRSSSWGKLLLPSYRSRLKLVILLSFFQAFSGASAIFFFAPIVFENVGFVGAQASLFSSIWIGVVYLIAILISFVAVDRMGRRILLNGSLFGMAVSLGLISLFGLLGWPYLDFVSLACILSYVAFFSFGAGPVPPMIIGEITPLELRGHAMTLMGLIGWVWNYIIATSFLPLSEKIEPEGVFLFYIFFCFIGAFLFMKILPETKQKSLDEIDQLFKK